MSGTSIIAQLFIPLRAICLLLDLFQLPLTLRFFRPGHLLWTLFMRGDVSSNWNLSFSSATTIVPTKSDSDVILCLQLQSKIKTCTLYLI